VDYYLPSAYLWFYEKTEVTFLPNYLGIGIWPDAFMCQIHNNHLKLNENITLFFRDIIFADLRTLYTFHFEVKL
jgi:hypothetical protein